MPTVPTIVLLPIGIPGIGKSTLLRQQADGQAIAAISRDDIRTEVNGGEATYIPANEPKITRLSFQRLRKALKDSRKRGHSKYISLDMTNINARSRQDYLAIVQKFAQKTPVLLKVFHLPNNVDLSIKRQEGRTRQVERKIVQSFSDRFERFDAGNEIKGNAGRLSTEIYDVAEDGSVTQAVAQQTVRFGQRSLSLMA